MKLAPAATVIAPVAGSITKFAEPAPDKLYVNVVPASTSVAMTVPTAEPFAEFSGNEKV